MKSQLEKKKMARRVRVTFMFCKWEKNGLIQHGSSQQLGISKKLN